MKNIVFCGYDGKMGKNVLQYLSQFENLNIKYKINAFSTPLEKIDLKDIDVVVDFTCAKACYKHALYCATNKISFVSGTTGLKEDELNEIDALFKKNEVGCFICPNFSKGIQFILNSSPLLNTYFNECEIEETHHLSKLDKPSGTALLLKKYFPFTKNIISKRKKHYQAIHKLSFKNLYEECIIIHTVNHKFAYGDLIKKAIDDVGLFTGLKETF